ncbi:MAG: SCP2 sterol-binding domain-containing protein [Candidatus Thermoplasmatota archaeon]|jgi:putative sterol carrier protein|nr:SCP2 sterol-binding domain-containing protein [Candidatus Thermoplasmatota archaeon]
MSSFDLLKETIQALDAKPDLKTEIISFNKSFQFNVSDGKPFYVDLSNGGINIAEGNKQSPSATITAADQVLVDVFTGKLDGVKAFMQGKLKISGDIFSVQKLSSTIMKARK